MFPTPKNIFSDALTLMDFQPIHVLMDTLSFHNIFTLSETVSFYYKVNELGDQGAKYYI